MDPPPKIWFAVETDDATCLSRGYEKSYHSHNEPFRGEQDRLLSRSENGLRELGGTSSLGFMVVRGRVGEAACIAKAGMVLTSHWHQRRDMQAF